jgi:hypothetical protein
MTMPVLHAEFAVIARSFVGQMGSDSLFGSKEVIRVNQGTPNVKSNRLQFL